MLATYPGVPYKPHHLSASSEGQVLVADNWKHRILLLNSQLRQERVLVDTNSPVKPWRPTRLHYNELTSQIHIVHSSSSSEQSPSDIISLFCLR